MPGPRFPAFRVRLSAAGCIRSAGGGSTLGTNAAGFPLKNVFGRVVRMRLRLAAVVDPIEGGVETVGHLLIGFGPSGR